MILVAFYRAHWQDQHPRLPLAKNAAICLWPWRSINAIFADDCVGSGITGCECSKPKESGIPEVQKPYCIVVGFLLLSLSPTLNQS
jgi:hypothetical protein